MKMLPTYVLTDDEYVAVRPIRPFIGYTLTEPERSAEQAAVGCLFRRNDPFRAGHYAAAYQALLDLERRLLADCDPNRWEGAAAFMLQERRRQADAVREAIAALPRPDTLEIGDDHG